MVNRFLKYLTVFGIMVVMCITTILPVYADNEFYIIPDDQLTAYKYWFGMGGKTTYDYENYDDSVYIPVHSYTTTTNYNGYNCTSTTSNANFANYCRYYNSSNSSLVNPKETTTNSAYYETAYVGDTKFNLIDGTLTGFVSPTSYDSNKSFWVGKDQKTYVAFWATKFISNDSITIYKGGTNNAIVTSTLVSQGPNAGVFRRHVFVFTAKESGTNISVNWGNLSNVSIRPIVLARDFEISDRVRDLIGLDSRMLEAIKNGNNETIEFVMDNDEAIDMFNNTATNMHNLENDFNSNMNNAFDEINLNNSIISNSKFISSANWLRRRFDDLIIGTPFELVLVFSLILGLALTIVGKLRG